MTIEKGSSTEVKFDKQLLLCLLESTDLARKIKRGFAILKKDDVESGFSVGIGPSGDLVFSSQVTGETRIYAKSVDDYILRGGLVKNSVDLKKIKWPGSQDLIRAADFHFHPVGDTTPSYEDANNFVNRVYKNIAGKMPVHKRFFGGIFAGTDQQMSCLFYGLGRPGLISTDYQAWDSLNKASGYKAAMRRSGFWIEETTILREDKKLLWDTQFIDAVAKNIEG